MYKDQVLEGRLQTFNATVEVQLKDGTKGILKDVYLEATVPILKCYEPSPVEWGVGYWYYDFAVDVEDLDQDYTEHDLFEIDKVLRIIKADWDIIDEWEYNPWEYQYA